MRVLSRVILALAACSPRSEGTEPGDCGDDADVDGTRNDLGAFDGPYGEWDGGI